MLREDSHKPGAGMWATLALMAVLVAYPLSVGPAMWLSRWLGMESFLIVDYPIGWLASNYKPCGYALYWYLQLWGIHPA